MLQPHLGLLLDWMREKANVYTRGTNGNVRTANEDTDESSHDDGDTYLDAHLSDYGHGHGTTSYGDVDSYLDAHFSGYRHGHAATSHSDDDGYLDAHLGGYEHSHGATLVLEHGLAGFTDQASGQEGQSVNPANPVLTPELKAGLAALASVDDDADGLTNTQEQWWCTGSWSLTLKSS